MDAFRDATGNRIRKAQERVLTDIRPWLYYDAGGNLCIQLNEPNAGDPNAVGAVISHGVKLENDELRSVVRGWVMGVASTIPDEPVDEDKE